ncbi:MAG: hypothetical protein L0332_01930 [Chloroflexi bacterium]|nr:hypothetical protein [Chloroflexota bacterium]MCI0580886.1 hypothetical protein [Chloroflexota bacterium]MCI0649734.1 hypothetical protein [Chloroflexota bacterium]MCI0725473.1 hypothetical protein [Chloroflexota bacterium]
MRVELRVDKPYDFAQSMEDYGWISLAPCRWVEESQALEHVQQLSSGRVALVQVRVTGESDSAAHLEARVEAAASLSAVELAEIESNLRWMLRLDEEFASFYSLAAGDPLLWQQVGNGRGRLLRSPSLFEDVVKTICTTNTTWRQTVGMVERLVQFLGSPYPADPGRRAFPTPAQVAAAEPELLQKEVRLGYRGPYIRQLAEEVATGQRDLEGLKCNPLPAAELKKQLKSIKGVGDYAAHTLLMALGHYSALALDSEMRSLVTRKYFNGQPPADKELLAVYDRWGEWKYLAYWFDLLT